MAAPQFLRFVPPGQPDSFPWFVGKAGMPPDEWLFFVPTSPEAIRRKISPVPPDWHRLNQAQLGELWARATPARLPTPAFLRNAPHARLLDKRPQPRENIEAELLWERGRRNALEELLRQTEGIAHELQKDLESANAELRALNEEIQHSRECLALLPP